MQSAIAPLPDLTSAQNFLTSALQALPTAAARTNRHLTVRGQVGEMRLHAVVERATAGLHVGASRLDVRCANLGDRRGGDGGMRNQQPRAPSAAMQVNGFMSKSSPRSTRMLRLAALLVAALL
jgi:hypothetical protein